MYLCLTPIYITKELCTEQHVSVELWILSQIRGTGVFFLHEQDKQDDLSKQYADK